jgi:hypothetical protein
MNSRILILKMGEEVIFAHNQATGFLSNTSFNTDSLFATIVILENKHYKSNSYGSSKASTHTPSFPTFCRLQYIALITIKH